MAFGNYLSLSHSLFIFLHLCILCVYEQQLYLLDKFTQILGWCSGGRTRNMSSDWIMVPAHWFGRAILRAATVEWHSEHPQENRKHPRDLHLCFLNLWHLLYLCLSRSLWMMVTMNPFLYIAVFYNIIDFYTRRLRIWLNREGNS